MRQLAAFDMHAAELGATMQRGNVLQRIQQAARIECALDAAEAFQFVCGKLLAHLVYFFDADAMLAGDGTADFDALLQHFGSEGFGAMQLVRIVGIEQNQRMQVAVAGMKHVGTAQAPR